VAQVADEFRERQKRGEQPDPEEYAARYPQHAAEIREVLEALHVVHLSAQGECPAEAPSDGGEVVTGCLGDYRILREVGRGGMGIVYEAEQVSLNRHVALKVFSFHKLSDPTFLDRFRLEARAAGRLHHTNIVPVFGVGQEGGLLYYAMQFIQGQG